MEVTTHLSLWFKFKLIFARTILNPLNPQKYIEETRLLKDKKGNFMGIMKKYTVKS